MTANLQGSLFVEELSLPASIGRAAVASSTIRTLLTPGRGSTASFDYTLNAYRGCTFGCAYCYAPSFEHREGHAAKWGEWVEVKELALELLTGVSLKGKSIFMSSVTDPYQPIEAKIGLTRKIVERLAQEEACLVVQTRGPLVVRDIDLLKRFRAVKVNVSIPTHCDEVRRTYEPSAPSIGARFRTVRDLKRAGLTVSVCVSPMLPVSDPGAFSEMINESGADMATASWFHESTRKFTATTRSKALRENQIQDWTHDRFQEVSDILHRRCSSFTHTGRAFGPV